MHKVKAKGILSAANGMNIYRGCQHGCIYCDARSKCYQMNHRFEDIEVKENAPDLLEKALKRKRRKCMIGTGAMSDPYIPLEKELKLTRRCLEIIDRYGFGVTVHTKSASVMRDIDLFTKINDKSKAVLQMTLTTADESLCRIIEPNVSVTKERFETLKAFHENGIPSVVWFSPFLPFINDTKENIDGLLKYCIDAKVRGIICFGIGLTLRGLKERYEVFHGVKIQDNALIAAATLSNRYITDRFLPDKAIDLVDEACAMIKTEMDSMPSEMDDLAHRITQLQIEQVSLKKETDALSQSRLKDLEKELAELQDKFRSMKAKEDAERKAAEEEAKKKADEEAKKAAEEAEKKRLEELAKKNEMPDYLKKYFEEQAAEKKASDEARTKEREEFKKLVETLTQKNTDQAKTYNEQMEAQSKTIKELQETIQKQAEEAKAKEEAAAKAKAKADHDAKILSKAKELGIPESRINEGFTLSDDATDEAIETYLSKVANNYKALQQPQFGGSYRASEGEPTKEDVDNVAASLVQSL